MHRERKKVRGAEGKGRREKENAENTEEGEKKRK